ncbi:hypothetical protein [Amycolatopsis sp. lyj-112]
MLHGQHGYFFAVSKTLSRIADVLAIQHPGGRTAGPKGIDGVAEALRP